MTNENQDSLLQEKIFEQNSPSNETWHLASQTYQLLAKELPKLKSESSFSIKESTMIRIERKMLERARYKRWINWLVSSLIILFLITFVMISFGNVALFLVSTGHILFGLFTVVCLVTVGWYLDRKLIWNNV